MFRKSKQQEVAIRLRKSGKTYSEILKEIPVAKSTLSLWLRGVHLSKNQVQAFSEKKRIGQLKGAFARKQDRISRQKTVFQKAHKEVGKLTKRELWLIGVALYWAEGSKEKEYQPGSGLRFSNSDPAMIRLFIKWLVECCEISKDRIYFNIYIHETYKGRIDEIVQFWSVVTGFPEADFDKIYFKRHKTKTKRKNQGILYNGLLRVNVRASSELVRKIHGWVTGMSAK
jgi:hypothetical protein